MQSTRRFLALTLVCVLLLCLFAACGSSDSSTSTDAAAESTTTSTNETVDGDPGEAVAEEADAAVAEEADAAVAEEADAAVAEEADAAADAEAEDTSVSLPISEDLITLTYWTTVAPNYADVVTSLQDLLLWNEMENRTNIRVEATLVNAQAGEEQFALMITSGLYTDLLDSPGANYSTGLSGALDDEVLIDLTDIVEEYMPNYNAIIQTNEEYAKGVRLDDGRIGMIYGLNTEDYQATEGPVIRQDWLDELGLETPVTYDDLHDVLVAFKENYGATMWIPYSGSPLGNYLGAGYGIATTYLTHMSGREPFYQVDGEVRFGPMEDEYYEYLAMLNSWYEEGLIWSDFVSYTEKFNAPPDSGITSGEFGVWFSGYSNFQVWTAAADDPDFHIVAFTDPVMEEGDTNHLRAETYLVTNGGVGISTNCEYVEEAAKLIDYWFSEEGRWLLTFGIEGETYELDADGHPQYTELITNNPDGYSLSSAIALYIGGFGFHTISHEDYIYLDQGYTQDQIDAPNIWMSTSDNSYGIPTAVSMTTDESTELSSLLSDIGTYVSTWTLQAITGSQELTEESIAEFRTVLTEQLHIEDAIAIKQAALDRYNAR